MSTNLTDKFIDGIYDFSNSEFSDSGKHQAKRCLIDYLACTYAGAEMLRTKGDSLLKEFGEVGDTNVLGFQKKSALAHAVFVNGFSAHMAELDDGVISGMVHPGSPLFSALLPIAEKENCTGEQFLKAIIVGYEVAVRLADVVQPSHKKKGFHASATCGAIGTAVGIAVMLGFTKKQLKDTFSAAVVSGYGTLKVLEDDSQLKPYNVARAALDGLLATYVTKAGFIGPDDALSGNNGFISIFSDEYDLKHLELKEDDPYAVDRVYVKPYAACRYCHPAVEAILRIKKANDILVSDIKNIHVTTYYLAVAKHDHTVINNVSSAKMSIPYSVAAAFVFGRAGLNEYTVDAIENNDVVELTKKVLVDADDEMTAQFPVKSPAKVKIILNDGSEFVEAVEFPKGEPEIPLTDEEIDEKFISLSQFGNKEEKEIQQILKYSWNLVDDIQALFKVL